VLLDLDDPTKMIAALKEPLLTATAEEQDGYVPNVVYTCGAMTHGDILVIPYGVADNRINFATASIDALVKAMTASDHPTIVSKVHHRRIEDLALEH
jgi:predicted GH43/DUF377 family glycosyl hydrolase